MMLPFCRFGLRCHDGLVAAPAIAAVVAPPEARILTDDMPTTATIETVSSSTNPFRRTPSVSPSPNNTAPTAHINSLRDNDTSSVLAPTAVTTASANGAVTTGAGQRVSVEPAFTATTSPDSPPDLPPPPAYVQVEESSSNFEAPTLVPALPARSPSAAHVSEVAQPVSSVATAVDVTPSGAAPNLPAREPEVLNEYVLKPIDWIDPTTGVEKRIKIITQNHNGPCPLLALCNTLILQGKVAIRPYDRPTIGYDHLLELLADYLLMEEFTETNTSISTSSTPAAQRTGERVKTEKIKSRLEIESALRLLPHLEHGLDVNVYFKSIRGFEPTAELGLFHTFGVELVHGWVVSPVTDTAMYALVDGPANVDSYNKAVECIVSGDDAGGGLVVEDLRGNVAPISSSSSNHGSVDTRVSAQEAQIQNEKIAHALVVQEFMNATKTQLTQYGLHVLQESLPEGHLCAFFRNNHFCTLFKNPMDGKLYTIVTDQSLAHEQSIVWESLADVDGAGEFLDGLFRHGALEVGDYARSNQPLESQHSGHGDGGGDEDFALALQLQQQEEEEEARRVQRSHSRSSNSHGGSSSSNGNVNSNSNGRRSAGAYQPPIFETDEQMAARLHQEFLLSDQQEQGQQQQQRHQHQQLQHQQNANNAYPVLNQYPSYGAQGSSQTYGGSYPAYQQPPQRQQQYQQRPSSTASQSYRPSNAGPGYSDHNRIRNSSESSSRKDKDKCVIS
ncbi:hypothetical protein BGZ98_000495 [Dissophora globulifera]|nr:hypothetical protein BGZ98_000495 [Dissophora globulifera]